MPRIILIAGISGSGKTTLARELANQGASLLCVDHYYRGYDDVPLEQRRRLNFDSPDAIEHELLVGHAKGLAAGEPVRQPVYDHAAFVRHPQTEPIAPRDVVVVEGMFALHWAELREIATLRVFVDTPLELCLRRRLERDTQVFHRSIEDALLRYHSHVRPNQERYVLPTKAHADLVVTGEEPIDELVAQVRRRLDEATVSPMCLTGSAS